MSSNSFDKASSNLPATNKWRRLQIQESSDSGSDTEEQVPESSDSVGGTDGVHTEKVAHSNNTVGLTSNNKNGKEPTSDGDHVNVIKNQRSHDKTASIKKFFLPSNKHSSKNTTSTVQHLEKERNTRKLAEEQKQYELAKLQLLEMVQETLLAVNETGDKLQQRLKNAKSKSLQLEYLCKEPVTDPFDDKQGQLIKILGLRSFHLNKERCFTDTIFKCQEQKNGKLVLRRLQARRFSDFPWLIWDVGDKERNDDGLIAKLSSEMCYAFCGICRGALQRGYKPDGSQKVFIEGMRDWRKHCGEQHLQLHENHRSHRAAVDYLLGHFNPRSVYNQIHEQANTDLINAQQANCSFFAKVIHSLKFLANKGDSFYGNTSNEGRLANTLDFISYYDPSVKKHMNSNNKLHVTNLQPRVVNFILGQFQLQVLRYLHSKISEASYCCIIVDEWSCKHSNREYCSISLRTVSRLLQVETSFLGFHYLPRANAATIVETMIHAMTKIQPHVQGHRIVVQTYDGASTMQGEHNGVQRKFRDQYAPFALSIHCTAHRLNLSAKGASTSNRLMQDIISYCKVIIKLLKYSPKRGAHFDKIKVEIRNDEDIQGANNFKTIKGMILHFSITRWTTRKDSFCSIYGNYYPIVKTFVDILISAAERRSLDSDHEAEICGMITQMQQFRFFFGLKLCILIFSCIDITATALQGDDVNIVQAVHHLAKLRDTLVQNKLKFEDFWKDVEHDRLQLNELFSADLLVGPSMRFDGISDGSIDSDIPRSLRRTLRYITDEQGGKAYWCELFNEVFEDVLDEIDQRMQTPALITYSEIESILVYGIMTSRDRFQPEIGTILKYYGNDAPAPNGAKPPLDGLTTEIIKNEINFLKVRWAKYNKDKVPKRFEEVATMVSDDIQINPANIELWQVNAPYIVKMVGLVLVAAGTSAFAERTFSLSRKIKTWLRSHLSDDLFATAGILAWYRRDELDKMLNLVEVANTFANESTGRKGLYGHFQQSDFPNNSC